MSNRSNPDYSRILRKKGTSAFIPGRSHRQWTRSMLSPFDGTNLCKGGRPSKKGRVRKRVEMRLVEEGRAVQLGIHISLYKDSRL